MLRYPKCITMALVLLLVPAVGLAQEDQLEDLRQEMLKRKTTAELEWIQADLLELGASPEAVRSMVAQIAALGGAVSFDRTRRRAGAELDGIDPAAALAFVEKVQTFKRDMLEQRGQWADSRSATTTTKAGSGCLAGVLDCIIRVDQIYLECIECGLSLSYCSDLWLDLIENCEDKLEECGPG